MTARRIPDDARGRDEAIRVLGAGGVAAIPTDTVYGLAVGMDTPGGIERLFEVKGRPEDRAIAVLFADASQAAAIGHLTPEARRLAEALWPGGLTLVIRRLPDVALPDALTAGRETIGVRVPDHEAPRVLAAALGPLPTTSANRSGEPEAPDGAAIERLFGDRIDLILDDGPARGGRASTVVDVSGPEPRILREGAIPAETIESVLRDMGR